MSHILALLALTALMLATPSHALVPGGPPGGGADCLAQWRVTTRGVVPGDGVSTVDCQDGDPSCDADGTENGTCTFDVSVCVLDSQPRTCAAGTRVRGFSRLSKGLRAPASLSEPGCGPATAFRAALRHGRLGTIRPSRRLRLGMAALGEASRDVDRLALRCVPAETPCQIASTCPLDTMDFSAPNELMLTLTTTGSDVDYGRSGAAHSLALSDQVQLQVCLRGCDATTDSLCDAHIATGVGTPNGSLLGPPIAVVLGDRLACVVEEWAGASFQGTADLATGSVDATVRIRAKIYFPETENGCPRCVANLCDGGANVGFPCSTSRECPVSENTLAGAVETDVVLTTGTAELDAACAEPEGTPATDDGCGPCDAQCTGSACADQITDPESGAVTCLDQRGGVSQQCCAQDPTRACFPSPIVRTGRADQPTPAWPDLGYPKASRPVLVAASCTPASGVTDVDDAIGLPGPSARIHPAKSCWLRPLGIPPPVGY